MFETLVRDVQDSTPAGQLRALTRAFHVAFLSLAVPGLPLGLLYNLTRPQTYSWRISLAFVGIAVLLGTLTLWRTRPNPATHSIPAERLSSAMLSASAASIPFLLGCAAFHDLKTWSACWVVAAAGYVLARTRLRALLPGGALR